MIQSFKINSLNFKFLKCLKYKTFKIKFSLIGLRSSSIRIQFSRALNFLNLRLKFLNLHPINTKFHFKNFSNIDSNWVFLRNWSFYRTCPFFGSKCHYCYSLLSHNFKKSSLNQNFEFDRSWTRFRLLRSWLETFGYHFSPSVMLNQAHHRPCITVCHVIIYGFSRDSSPEFLF